MEFKDWILLFQAGFTITGILFLIYRTFTDPDIKAAKKIALIELQCSLKHKNLDDNIDDIKNSISLIENNDLKHIEEELIKLKENQIKIFTILEERLPNRK